MKLIKIDYNNENNNKNKYLTKFKTIFNNHNIILLLLIINIIISNYLLIENKKNKKIIKEILDFKNSFNLKNNTLKNNYFPNNDKEMIGLYYPEINFDKIKVGLINSNIIDSLIDLVNQLEIKLIYLEKEINITKLISFYTSRKYYLRERNISYNENNLTQLHEIINWITIHKSSQLKGIASDKYLACKYIKLKLGKNLCKHRIAVYNSLEELNYNKLSKYGNIVLKVSNSCWKTVFISNDTKIDNFEKKMKIFKKLYEFEHGIIDVQPFHLYAKKRIIVEKQFDPLTNLYEFKIFIINNKIKFIYLEYYLNKAKKVYLIYDTNYNFIFKNKIVNATPINLTSLFKKDVLKKIKEYAIKLSKDFPNFIRVDLYIFHDKIYLSELTFASYSGLPMDRKEKYVKDAIENFSRIDDYY
jgi:hypothetical protein